MSNENTVRFAKSIPENIKLETVNEILRMNKLSDRYSHPEFEIRLKRYTPDERVYLQTTIDGIKNTLSSMGVSLFRTVEGLEFSLDTFRFYEFHTDKEVQVAGQAEQGRGVITIFCKKGTSIKSPVVKGVLAHEMSHFTSTTTMMKDHTESGDAPTLQFINYGFDTVSLKIGDNHVTRGLFSESMAEMLAYVVLAQDNQTLRSPYVDRLPFMVSMIKNFASKNNITERAAFEHFYSTYANRNMSLFKALVNQYGTQFVRRLNTIRTANGFLEHPEELDEIARLGKFEELYHSVQIDFTTEKGISLDQIGGNMAYKPLGKI